MNKASYQFAVNCLSWSIVLIVIASIVLSFLQLNTGQLIPILAPIATLLGGLLVVPPTSRG